MGDLGYKLWPSGSFSLDDGSTDRDRQGRARMDTAEARTSISPGATRPLHRQFLRQREKPRAPFPLGLFGTLGLILAVESFIAHDPARFTDTVAYAWSRSARDARVNAKGNDVLFAGDSLVKHGLVPSVVSESGGLTAWNLATPAAPVTATHAILHQAFDAGAAPKAVVFDLKSDLLLGGPRYSIRYWHQVLTPGTTWSLLKLMRSASFTAELIAGVLPSFRCRHEIRGDLMAALQGQTGPLRGLNQLGQRNWEANQGANVASPRPGYAGQVSEADHDRYKSRGFHAERANADYARRVIELVQVYGARPYLLLPPLVPELLDRRRMTGAEQKYEKFILALQRDYPALVVLDARHSNYPATAFVDPVHLAANGALALSESVAGVLKSDLKSPTLSEPGRWAKLPGYVERSLPPALEHVEISRARLAEKTRH